MSNGMQDLAAILERNGRKYNMEKINAAYAYAAEMHCGQFRQSG